MKNDLCHPTFTDKKVKSFWQVLLTKFLVDQIDKNVAMATSKFSRLAFFDCEKCIPNKTHPLSHPSHTPHHHP